MIEEVFYNNFFIYSFHKNELQSRSGPTENKIIVTQQLCLFDSKRVIIKAENLAKILIASFHCLLVLIIKLYCYFFSCPFQ